MIKIKEKEREFPPSTPPDKPLQKEQIDKAVREAMDIYNEFVAPEVEKMYPQARGDTMAIRITE